MFVKNKRNIIILLVINAFIFQPSLIQKLLVYKLYIYVKLYNTLIILVDLTGINSNHGPGFFIKGINQVLPFITKKCIFLSTSYDNKIKPDYYFIPFPKFNEGEYEDYIKRNIINKFILGPIFIPKKWNRFPNKKLWMERRIKEILNNTKGIIVHSLRVRDYLTKRSQTELYSNKFKIMRACSNLKPKRIKKFKLREIDILFFEKFADLDRKNQLDKLINLFNSSSSYKISRIKYGQYNKLLLGELANNSKFIIYFSFYDTGAIALKEIQNYGVFSFTHQKELAIDNKTSFFIPELAKIDNMEQAYLKIKNKIDIISRNNPNTKIIAKINQKINKCVNSLYDLCNEIK